MTKRRVFIVSHSFYAVQDLADKIVQKHGNAVEIVPIHRVYHVPERFDPSDIVISDGTCKDSGDQGSYGVYFSPAKTVRASGATHIGTMLGLRIGSPLIMLRLMTALSSRKYRHAERSA